MIHGLYRQTKITTNNKHMPLSEKAQSTWHGGEWGREGLAVGFTIVRARLVM